MDVCYKHFSYLGPSLSVNKPSVKVSKVVAGTSSSATFSAQKGVFMKGIDNKCRGKQA
jgi:hypothetical protein